MTILRALAASVRLPERPPFSSGRGGMLGGMGSLLSGSATSGMDMYREIGAVHGPTRRICESIALVNWSLYAQTETAGETDRQLVDDATAPAKHPGTAVWTHPNGFMTRRMFLFLAQLWQETGGGVYWLIVQGGNDGSPFLQAGITADLELWPIRKDRITPIPDPDKYLAGYVYSVGMERIPLPVQAVVPIGWPDPLDPLGFAGPLQSIGTDMEAERYASQYNRNVFLNQGEPGGVIEFENPLPPDRFDELVLRWREQHQGLNNAKRVAIIEGGKWVEASHSHADLEYEKLRHLSREHVMFADGMPYAMMQSNDVNLANAQTGERNFARYTLRPRLEAIKEALNERVLPYLGDNLTMDYDLPLPEDEAFDVFAGMSGWIGGVLTQNESRQAMGYDAIPEGDRYSWELTGAPPKIPPATPPKKPTTLSYRKAAPPASEGPLTDIMTERLRIIGEQYARLASSRNGR